MLAVLGAATTTIAFGNSYTAFGTEFGFRTGNLPPFPTGAVSVQLFNRATAVGGALGFSIAQTGTFVGFTSTQPFDRATFTNTALSMDAYQGFDKVRVGSRIAADAAPELGCLALLALAGAPVAGVIARRWRGRRRRVG